MAWDIATVRTNLQDLLLPIRRKLSRIWIRLLAFNILLLFLPAIGLFYFQVYESELLESQEQSMVQQGRILAAALADSEDLAQDAPLMLGRIYPETVSRLRVINQNRQLLADSSQAGTHLEQSPTPQGSDITDSWLYKVGQTLFNLVTRDPLSNSVTIPEPTYDPLAAPEVAEALAGRYGAYWRVSPGQRSVTLYSAIPIRREDQIAGVVVVSQSTLRVLQKLYTVRLTVFKIVLVSVIVAFILSLIVAKTIASPLQALKKKASSLAERHQRLESLFGDSKRSDEIGDLERALAELSRRLADRIRFIESFASDLSHELKNPLASVRSSTELLKDVQEPADRKRFLNIIENEVARMEQLISRVREVSFLDAQIGKEARQSFCLNQYLADLLDGYGLLRAGDNQLRFKSLAPPVYVEVNPDRLTQAIENLLENALSFSPAGAPVEVELSQEGRWAIVTVADSGPGIPPEHLDRIFNRFFSHRVGEKASKSQHIGLGLSVAKTVVEGYGGKILAGNRPEGGAIFSFKLKTSFVETKHAER